MKRTKRDKNKTEAGVRVGSSELVRRRLYAKILRRNIELQNQMQEIRPSLAALTIANQMQHAAMSEICTWLNKINGVKSPNIALGS